MDNTIKLSRNSVIKCSRCEGKQRQMYCTCFLQRSDSYMEHKRDKSDKLFENILTAQSSKRNFNEIYLHASKLCINYVKLRMPLMYINLSYKLHNILSHVRK